MATTYTPSLMLPKPANGDRNWDVPILATINLLDSLAPLSALAVGLAEIPSASLNIKVAAGSFHSNNGSVVAYAGSTSFALTASATNYVWLTNAGTLTKGTAWPTTGGYVPLATVVTGAGTITAITDARIALGTVQCGPTFGTGTLVAGSLVVAATSVTSASKIHVWLTSPGGTVGYVYVSAQAAGTGFTVTSTSGSDTSTFAYSITES